MINKEIAVLLTCFNRKHKTVACLHSFYESIKPIGYSFDIYLVDDGSTDNTSDEVKQIYPDVSIIKGNGNLYWAGGMRLAWNTAISNKKYSAFLLLNDDVVLNVDFIDNLIETEKYSLSQYNRTGIYSGATIDKISKNITYGGERIKTNHFLVKSQLIIPTNLPQECDLTNANILWIGSEVVEEIGIFDDIYTHGIADFDYSLRAKKRGIPVYLAPNVGGICTFDHGVNWKSKKHSFKERVSFLKSPKGLAYHEYLFYIKRHFPLYLPYSFTMLWVKTFFPFLWDKFKK